MEDLFDQLKSEAPVNTVAKNSVKSSSEEKEQEKDDLTTDTKKQSNDDKASSLSSVITAESVSNENSGNETESVGKPKRTESRKRSHSPVAQITDTKKPKYSSKSINSEKEKERLSLDGIENSIQTTKKDEPSTSTKKRNCVVRIRRMNLEKYIADQKKAIEMKTKSSPRKAKTSSPKSTPIVEKSIFKTPPPSRRSTQKIRNSKSATETLKVKSKDLSQNRDLIKKYGSRFFRSYVKIKRCKAIPLLQNQQYKTKSDHGKNVSFSESVEILGSDSSNDNSCVDITKNIPITIESTNTSDDDLDVPDGNNENVVFAFERNLTFPPLDKDHELEHVESAGTSSKDVIASHDNDDNDVEMPSLEQSPFVTPHKDDDHDKATGDMVPSDVIEELRTINSTRLDEERRASTPALALPHKSTNHDAIDNACITNGEIATECNNSDAHALDDNSNSAIEKQTDSDISFSMQANNSNSSASFVSAEERPLLNGPESKQMEVNDELEKKSDADVCETEVNGNVEATQIITGALVHENSPDFRLHVGSPLSDTAEINDIEKDLVVSPLRTVTCAVDDEISLDLFGGESSISSCQYMSLTTTADVKKNVTDIIEDLTKDIGMDDLNSEEQQPGLSSDIEKKDS